MGSQLTEQLTSKPIATALAASDKVFVNIGGLIYQITRANLAASLPATDQRKPVTTKTASSYTATTSDGIINVDTSSNAVNINMPPAADLYSASLGGSLLLYVNHLDATNNATITPNGSELIDGGSSKTIAGIGGKLVYSDGSNLFTL